MQLGNCEFRRVCNELFHVVIDLTPWELRKKQNLFLETLHSDLLKCFSTLCLNQLAFASNHSQHACNLMAVKRKQLLAEQINEITDILQILITITVIYVYLHEF